MYHKILIHSTMRKYYNKNINKVVRKLKRKEWRDGLENEASEYLKKVVNNKNFKKQKMVSKGTKLCK